MSLLKNHSKTVAGKLKKGLIPFQFFENTVGVFREFLLDVGLEHLVQGLGVLEFAQEVIVTRLFRFLVLKNK